MVSPRYEKAARLFRALAHPARLRILDALRYGEECVCHLEALLGKPQAYVSQQLAVLREAGLVRDRKDGQRVYYAICDERMLSLLEEFLGPRTSPTRLDHCRCPKCQVSVRV
ncbi:MAG: winged helix-turn-helix transcriptional regulator [Chloroflexi bacterium]|nr:winged helix-turn-helix transcriptional regulator [Chloroflexota bacterium]